MYLPKFSEENDLSVLHGLIKENPLGAWTTILDNEITINHIPFILHENRGELGTLVGHVARANAVWEGFSTEQDSVVVFQGAQGYISPAWYPSKHENGKVVPTWNYAVVHAHGKPKVIEDEKWLLNHLNELTDLNESSQVVPWKVSDAPDAFIQNLVRMVVGIEIPLTRLEGKMKLSQNRSTADQREVIKGLMESDNVQANVLATMMNKRR